MLCESNNHGINLDMQVSLQYLYYLDQVRNAGGH
jgi:AMP deaminase